MDLEFTKEVEVAAEEYSDWKTNHFTIAEVYMAGAKWGREFGRREAIEALKNYRDARDLELNFQARSWADWLESRFGKGKE